ncbi:MAG: GIY-YIG nuclease family protein [Clostridia bacterium]|nr:GIY-YIG nuclease family protein [Clostridia bacterium]
MKDRKELKNSYKEKPEIGGVYIIKCAGNDRVWLKSARDLQGKINRFNFSVSTGLCPESDMRAEWEKYGPQAFSISVLEELKKGETQTDREFEDDIVTLLQIQLEKSKEDASDGT